MLGTTSCMCLMTSSSFYFIFQDCRKGQRALESLRVSIKKKKSHTYTPTRDPGSISHPEGHSHTRHVTDSAMGTAHSEVCTHLATFTFVLIRTARLICTSKNLSFLTTDLIMTLCVCWRLMFQLHSRCKNYLIFFFFFGYSMSSAFSSCV